MLTNSTIDLPLIQHKCTKLSALIFCAILVCTSASGSSLPAFPGAEGFGSTTTGGRGGKLFIVSSLNDSGPGTLRYALEASGPRIIVFSVGGVIDLGQKEIVIRHPFVTLAGQTAPGNGIVIKNSGIIISTHDVIIRGLRFRIGGEPDGSGGPNSDNRDGLAIYQLDGKEPYNIIIDHNSISWAVDENIDVWYGANNITISWNIISEGLLCSINPSGCSSYGTLLGSGTQNVSIHHNLYAHNGSRAPKITAGNSSVELINNVIYNWGDSGTYAGCNESSTGKSSSLNLIGNFYQAGPETLTYNNGRNVNQAVVLAECWETSTVFLKDNVGPKIASRAMIYDWELVKNYAGPAVISNSPAFPLSGVAIHSSTDIYSNVLARAGAIVPKRDAIDRRIVDDVLAKTGNLIDSVQEVEGWSIYPSINSAAADNDKDGIPDLWEVSHGLNPKDSNDANNDDDGDGYTNIEEYINSLIPNKHP